MLCCSPRNLKILNSLFKNKATVNKFFINEDI